jgi:hypothetical protein
MIAVPWNDHLQLHNDSKGFLIVVVKVVKPFVDLVALCDGLDSAVGHKPQLPKALQS